MTHTLNKTPKEIRNGRQLLEHLRVYIAWLDANPQKGNGAFDPDTGKIEYPIVSRCGGVTGFSLFLGLNGKKFLALRKLHPVEFQVCIEKLRQRLLQKAVAKDFAKLVAARPLLDFIASTNHQ